jgi:hypothetical protein
MFESDAHHLSLSTTAEAKVVVRENARQSINTSSNQPMNKLLDCTARELPSTKWYHGSSPQNKNLGFLKTWKKWSVFTRCVFTIPRTIRTKFKIQREKRKRQIDMWICHLCLSFTDSIHVGISFFCFSVCVSNLILKIIGIVNTHLMNTYIFWWIF